MKSQPFQTKILNYQRDLVQAGLYSIGDPTQNKRGLDGGIVVKILKEQNISSGTIKFHTVKQTLLTNYDKLLDLTKKTAGDTWNEE